MLTKTHLLSNIYRGINDSIILDFNNVVHYRITALKENECKGHPCTGTEALYRPYGPLGK
jgi:hypothetical protein